MSGIRSPRRYAGLFMMGTAVMVGAIGCSAGGGSASRSAAKGVGAPQQDAAAGKAQANGAVDKAGQPAKLTVDTPSIVFTGTVTVRVRDVGKAAADVGSLAAAAGGFVGGDDRTSDPDHAEARLIVRVPSAKFSSMVDGISARGDEEKRQLSTEDVTDQVTDVDARIATGQAGVDRVRDLLARAQNIGEIVSLESELSRREADLESLKSRKRKLDDLTTLSTITAVLIGPLPAAAQAQKRSTGFLSGLEAGWRSFTASLSVLSTVVGALLPWLVALAVPAGVAMWWVRRSRRPRTGPVPASE
ncbi:MAG: hypothetical protein QOE03_1324 [Micromonosporaceae bacterium]|nr:hypothetical protein [Micromonosporaceae bacterium]